MKIKKKLKSNLKDKISIDHYKKCNAMREYKLKKDYTKLKIIVENKTSEKSYLVTEVCKLQDSLNEVEYGFSKANDKEKESLANRIICSNKKHGSIFGVRLIKRNSFVDPDEKLNNLMNQHVYIYLLLLFIIGRSIQKGQI